jgi:hypothetical protein
VTGKLDQNRFSELRDEEQMKKMLAVVLTLMCASAVFALDNDDSVVRWKNIKGVITALNVDNPVGNIHSGTFAWTTRSGRASVNLSTGAASFEVEGLTIDGTTFSGTPGPITAVTGTLVCNAGDPSQVVLDTAPVSLNVHGDANFSGTLHNIPASCSNPLFLVRISSPAGAAGRWIATGTERFIGDDGK